MEQKEEKITNYMQMFNFHYDASFGDAFLAQFGGFSETLPLPLFSSNCELDSTGR